MRRLIILLALALPFTACSDEIEVDDSTAIISADSNPAAPGFDVAGSDPEAIALADTVMARMGGRDAWDGARYLGWTFFNGRRHLWDKHASRLRMDTGEAVVLMNLDTKEGRVFDRTADGTFTELMGDAAAEPLERAYGAWANDSYWLVMPFKLKDDGVTLKHLGERRAETTGRPARVLGLTFSDSTGLTPQNRYEVLVDAETGLIIEWAFFRAREDAEPSFRMPWLDYEPYGGLLLSGKRGMRGDDPLELTDLAVYDELPEEAFTDAEWVPGD